MKYILLALVFIGTQEIFIEPCFGQDILAKHKINGLKGLQSLAIVLRPTFKDNTQQEIATVEEWGDMVELGLHRHLPELKISDTKSATDWLELSIMSTSAGGALELSLYRWTKVLDSGEEIFSKVWSELYLVLGGSSKKLFKENLDALLTSFAADYLRAKR